MGLRITNRTSDTLIFSGDITDTSAINIPPKETIEIEDGQIKDEILEYLVKHKMIFSEKINGSNC